MRRIPQSFRVVTGVLWVASLAGCPPAVEPEPEPECSAEKACTDGLVCAEGECIPCKRDRECARDERCHPIEKRCGLRPCFGRECATHADCSLGLFCVQGLCLSAAESTSDGCSVISCADGETCNEGQRCDPADLVCEEDIGCTGDTDCGEGLRCNTGAGLCEAACTTENASEVCGILRQCKGGLCVDCLDDGDCGEGLTCDLVTNACVSNGSCGRNADCEVPLVCNRLTRQCVTSIPPCHSNQNCAADETCQFSTGKCVPLACLADRFESNETLETARAVPLGDIRNLTLCSGDVDYLKVALARGDRLQAVVEADSLVPFELAFLGPTGETLDEAERATDATVSVAGDYYVRARSTDAYVNYSIKLSSSRGTPCDDDADEPNDGFVQALVSTPDEFLGRAICPGDEDWFVLAVRGDQRIEAELESTPAQGDLDVYLYDANGRTLLAKSPSVAAAIEEAATASFTGDKVYVRVAGATSGVQNRYDLRIRLRAR